MARPDRQRKPKKQPDQRYRINPVTGQRELRPQFRPDYDPGPNPLDVKQFPDPPPGGAKPKQPTQPPFELPSDYPGAPKKLPPVPDFVKQMEQQRTQSGLRQRLEEKRNQQRKETALRTASERRSSRTRSRRGGIRVFRDPSNLNQYATSLARERDRDQGESQTYSTRDSGKVQDMDDTIVKGDDGQAYRYDSEIDGFTPVNFNPETNRYEFGGEKEVDRSGSMEAAVKESQQEFDKQMSELRRLSETDEQFGDTYRDFQQEYNEILRSQDLRPEERQAALLDLFDRGAATFEQTSGYRRQAAEAEQKAKSDAAKAKRAEEIQYKNRRAVEAKEQIRRQQENARYEDRKVRQKHSETTQNLDKAYDAYKKQFEASQADGLGSLFGEDEKPMSLEDFTAQHYRQMHEDEAISDEIRSVDGNISILETELGQLQDEDPLAYRDQLTEIYGQGRQEDADAAFQDYQNTRAARIAGVTRRIGEMKAQRKALMESKSQVYDAKYRSATSTEERRNRNLSAISEAQRVQEEERPGTLGSIFFNRGARQMEEIQEGTRKVAAGTEKLATREAMLQRDTNPMSPTFGQSTRTDSPEYIADMSGDRTLLGSLRRLAESENDPEKRKKYGGESVYKQQRLRAIQALEKVIQKEAAPGSDQSAGIGLRDAAVERLNQIMRFEQSLDKEQMGNRGQE